MARNRAALLTALGTDNFGSGLFLPVVLLYVTRVIGLPLATAGTVVSLGTIAGVAAPPLAGRLVDTVGPRPVVICSQVLQAAAAVLYLAARGVLGVAVAAAALAAGQQLFYSSLFALISDVAGHGPKDRPFAVAGMIRSACFGLGGLAAGALLSLAGPAAYRIAVAVDAASFAACAVLLAAGVRIPRPPRRQAARARAGAGGLLFAARTNALAEAAAPEAARGGYLAAFQYAFTIAGMIAPGVVALFSVAAWLPWLLAATCCGLAVVALRRLSGRLPARAVRPDSSSPGVNTQNQQIQGSVLRAT